MAPQISDAVAPGGPPSAAVDPPAPPPDLGRRAARGAATTLAAQGIRVVVQASTLILLSRLLSPKDFGLVAAVTAFTGIADLLRDFGLSSAAVQARTLSNHQRSNLFWINTATGAFAAAVVMACAVPIAGLYGDPEIAAIAQALAVVFLVDGVASQFRAELNRRLNFGLLAVADVGSQTLAGVVAISVAAVHPGTLALILLPIVQAVSELLILVVSLRWRPGLPRRGTNMRPLLSFGLSLFAVQLLTYASRNGDNVTVGKRFGASALGVYSRAFQFLELPLNQLSGPLNSVALPILSRLQDDLVRLMEFVRRGQNLLMQATLLLLTVAASQAAILVPGILGDQWVAAVPIFQILAIGGVFQTCGYATYWLFVATGNAAANLRYALLIRPLAIVAIVVGSFWGVSGVAWGVTTGMVAAWPIGLWWVGRATRIPTGVLFAPCLRTITCYAVAGLTAWSVPSHLVDNHVARLALGLVLFVVVLGVLILLVAGFRTDVTDVFTVASLLRGGDQAASRKSEPGSHAVPGGRRRAFRGRSQRPARHRAR